MLNPNTVFTAIISDISALFAAFGGIFLSNRHSAKMENLRISQEKLKRNAERVGAAPMILLTLLSYV